MRTRGGDGLKGGKGGGAKIKRARRGTVIIFAPSEHKQRGIDEKSANQKTRYDNVM